MSYPENKCYCGAEIKSHEDFCPFCLTAMIQYINDAKGRAQRELDLDYSAANRLFNHVVENELD